MESAGYSTSSQAAGGYADLTELALKKSGAGFLYQSDDRSIVHCSNLPVTFQPLASGAMSEDQIFGVEDGARLQALKREIADHGHPVSMEMEVPTSDGLLTYRIALERILAHDRAGVMAVITDITESRRHERVLKTLLRELSHRSKNLLAIIQGIATQTARQALSLDYFLGKFRGRIQSLASSQDLVTDSSWRGAYLFSLAEKQFSPYWPESEDPVSIRGINAHLSPNAALHIGLALHELVVNSASHGAIAAGVNSLTIDCFDTVFDDEAGLELAWIEHLPPMTEPRAAGEDHSFARTVLERVVPVAIGGKAIYMTASDRIEYRLTIPSREYEVFAHTS